MAYPMLAPYSSSAVVRLFLIAFVLPVLEYFMMQCMQEVLRKYREYGPSKDF